MSLLELLPNPQFDMFNIPKSYPGFLQLGRGGAVSLFTSQHYILTAEIFHVSLCACPPGLGDLLVPHGITWDVVTIWEVELWVPQLLYPLMPSGALPLWGLTASTRKLSENRIPVSTISEPMHLSLPSTAKVSFELYRNTFIFIGFSKTSFFLSEPTFFIYWD